MLVNQANNLVLAAKTNIATNFWQRFIGLSYRKELSADTVLIFPNCQIIHMFFMFFPLGLIFLNTDKEVVQVVKSISPWKISPHVKKAYYLIEGNPEVTKHVNVGDIFTW